MKLKYVISIFIGLFSFTALAAPETTNFQAHIAKPDGTDLESSSVTFTFKYKNQADNCTLFVETFSAINMTGSRGDINLKLGNGTSTFPVGLVTLNDIFSNAPSNTMACAEGGTYTPLALNEKRKMIVEFSYAGSNGLQTLTGTEISSVPYSMYASKAEDSDRLGGTLASLFVKFSDVTSCSGGQFLTFSGGIFSCAAPGAAVNFSGSLSGDVTGTQTATVVSSIRGVPVISDSANHRSGVKL